MPGNVVGFQTSSSSLLFFSFCFQGRSTESDVTPAFAFRSGLQKRHCAREVADFLLLLFLRPHTTEQGPGNTNPGGSQGSLLREPFTAARNIMILQNDIVTTIYIQNYKTSKYVGSDSFHTGELKQRQKKNRNIEMLWMFVYRQHIPSAAKKLKKIHVLKTKSTVETILKKKIK